MAVRSPALRENHDFLKLWAGETVSLFGSQISMLAVPLTAVVLLNASAFVLRYTVEEDDRLLLVNLGPDVDLTPVPEPLLGLPRTLQWKIIWSSESPDYGGQGVPAPMVKGAWHVPGESAVLLRPEPVPDADAKKAR